MMTDNVNVIKGLIKDAENGDRSALVDLVIILKKENLFSQKLIEDISLKGEAKYLENCCQHTKERAGITMTNFQYLDLQLLMTVLAGKYEKVLKTELVESESFNEIMDHISYASTRNMPYIGVLSDSSGISRVPFEETMLVGKGKNVYCIANIKQFPQIFYFSVYADKLNVNMLEEMALMNKDNDIKFRTTEKDVLPIHAEGRFQKIIKSPYELKDLSQVIV